MDLLNTAVFFLLGISFGSFLNVVADRLQRGMSLVYPPSHCFNCGHKLEYRDLVPVLSYLVLKGKCRYCRATISPNSFFVELLTGIFFALAWFQFGISLYLPAALFYICVLMLLGITDIKGSKLSSVLIYSMILISVVLSPLNQFIKEIPDFYSAITGFFAAFVAAALIWLIFKIRGFSPETNYIFLAGMTGAILGIPLMIVAVCLYAVLLLLQKILKIISKNNKAFTETGLIYSVCVISSMLMEEYILKIIDTVAK